jgi:hypothetical protein
VLVGWTIKIIVKPESLFDLEAKALKRSTFFTWQID